MTLAHTKFIMSTSKDVMKTIWRWATDICRFIFIINHMRNKRKMWPLPSGECLTQLFMIKFTVPKLTHKNYLTCVWVWTTNELILSIFTWTVHKAGPYLSLGLSLSCCSSWLFHIHSPPTLPPTHLSLLMTIFQRVEENTDPQSSFSSLFSLTSE